MRTFYGVSLRNSNIATVLDLLRFLGEPDSIRFSHITLRGPYKRPLPRSYIRRINDDPRYHWSVELTGPIKFFSNLQSTVSIGVNLHSLTDLLYKPDFPNGSPHITLYDGKNRAFAEDIFDLLKDYRWHLWLDVSRLHSLERRTKVDSALIGVFDQFCRYLDALVIDPKNAHIVRDYSEARRLELMRGVLERVVQQPSGHDRFVATSGSSGSNHQQLSGTTVPKWQWQSVARGIN